MDSRKLGRLEETMETLNSRAKTWNIVTISRIKGPLTEEILRQSLDIIQHRHPRLNSRIIRYENNLYFESKETPKIALEVVNKLKNEQWQEVVDDEMNKEIDSSKGLLRAVLVHIQNDYYISYLITTVHHAIADGLSCIQLHSEILTCCQKVLSGELVNPLPSLSLFPPIEELLPEGTNNFRGKIKNILFLLQLAFQKLWNRPETLGFEKYVSIADRHCEIVHRQLDQELTQQFINRCRQENTTVHSALCAAMMFTVAKKIVKGNKRDIRVNCLSYLDLRRRLKPAISDEHMTVLAASMMEFYTVRKNTSFWELARDVKQKLEITTKSDKIFNMMLVAQELVNFCFRYPQQVSATVSVSNIGKVNIPKSYGEFELEEISFAASHAINGGVFTTHVLTFQGKMMFNFVFSQPSISRETMKDIVNKFINCIFDVCNINSDKMLINKKSLYSLNQQSFFS
jgi:hypothetical protein